MVSKVDLIIIIIIFVVVVVCPEELPPDNVTESGKGEDCEDCPDEFFCGKPKRTFCNYDTPQHVHTNINTPEKSLRIMSGKTALYGEWPWLVAIAPKNNKRSPICSATMINNRWSLTIWYCIERFRLDELELQFGQHDTNQEDEPLKVEVRALLVAEKKCPDPARADDCLTMVKHANVAYSFSVLNLCLPENAGGNNDKPGTYAMIAGWGIFDNSGASKAPRTRELKVKIMTASDCRRIYENFGMKNISLRVTDKYLCSGDANSKNPICKGDSGGPMMRYNNKKLWVLNAVMSSICTCERQNEKKVPGIYFRVTPHLDWINEVKKRP